MIYLALWLIFGCAGYMMALAVQLEQLSARVARLEKNDKRKIWNSNTDYARGLSCILLGPFAIALAFWFKNW